MTILAVSTLKQLVLFQARPIQKRIRPFNVGISLEAWLLDLDEFKWLRIAAVAFLTLAWGLPFHRNAPLLSARVEYRFYSWLLSASPKTTEFQLWHYCTGWQTPAHRFPRDVPQAMHVLLSISSLFAKSCLFTEYTYPLPPTNTLHALLKLPSSSVGSCCCFHMEKMCSSAIEGAYAGWQIKRRSPQATLFTLKYGLQSWRRLRRPVVQ